MQLSVDGICSQKHVSLYATLLASQNSIGFSHGLQVFHEGECVGIVDDDIVNIDGEEVEACFLQQTTHVLDVCQW